MPKGVVPPNGQSRPSRSLFWYFVVFARRKLALCRVFWTSFQGHSVWLVASGAVGHSAKTRLFVPLSRQWFFLRSKPRMQDSGTKSWSIYSQNSNFIEMQCWAFKKVVLAFNFHSSLLMLAQISRKSNAQSRAGWTYDNLRILRNLMKSWKV